MAMTKMAKTIKRDSLLSNKFKHQLFLKLTKIDIIGNIPSTLVVFSMGFFGMCFLRKGVFRISEIAEKVAIRKMLAIIHLSCLVYLLSDFVSNL